MFCLLGIGLNLGVYRIICVVWMGNRGWEGRREMTDTRIAYPVFESISKFSYATYGPHLEEQLSPSDETRRKAMATNFTSSLPKLPTRDGLRAPACKVLLLHRSSPFYSVDEMMLMVRCLGQLLKGRTDVAGKLS